MIPYHLDLDCIYLQFGLFICTKLLMPDTQSFHPFLLLLGQLSHPLSVVVFTLDIIKQKLDVRCIYYHCTYCGTHTTNILTIPALAFHLNTGGSFVRKDRAPNGTLDLAYCRGKSLMTALEQGWLMPGSANGAVRYPSGGT